MNGKLKTGTEDKKQNWVAEVG